MTTRKKLLDILTGVLNIKAEITDSTRFKEDLGIDSLDLVEFMMETETTFEIDIPDEEISKMLTFGEFLQYVKSHAKKKPVEIARLNCGDYVAKSDNHNARGKTQEECITDLLKQMECDEDEIEIREVSKLEL